MLLKNTFKIIVIFLYQKTEYGKRTRKTSKIFIIQSKSYKAETSNIFNQGIKLI